MIVKKSDARCNFAHQRSVPDCIRCIAAREAARTIATGRYSETLAKRPAERLMTLEAALQRNIQHRIAGGEKHGCRASQPKPQRELFGRFAGSGRKNPMQMKRRHPRLAG